MYDPNQGYPQGGPGPQGGYPQGGYPQGGYPQGASMDVLDPTKLPPGYPPPGGYPAPGYPQPGGYPPPGGYPQSGGYGPPPQPGFVPPSGGGGYNSGGYAYDAEAGTSNEEIKGFGFTDESIRRGFIRKVYSILMLQLILTFGIVALFVYHTPTKVWARNNSYMVWVALGVLLVTMIAMACCENVRRTAPTNMIFLFLFTLAESFLLGFVSSTYEPDAVVLAVGITAAVCLALTLFALQTKWDFTVCGGALLVILVVFMLFGLIKIFLPQSKTLQLVYASIGALIFSFYLIYDTQLMMGGKHKYSISPEEYIFAALNLYLDIINIFMYILQIIGASRD